MTVFENMMKQHGSDVKLVVANTMLENNIIHNYENTGYTAYSGIDGYKYIDPVRKSDSILPLTLDEVLRISKVFTEPCTMVCKDNDDARHRCLRTYIDYLNSQISDEIDDTDEDADDDIDVIEITHAVFSQKRSLHKKDFRFEALEVKNSQGNTISLPGYYFDFAFWTYDSGVYDKAVRKNLYHDHAINRINHIFYVPKLTRGDFVET